MFRATIVNRNRLAYIETVVLVLALAACQGKNDEPLPDGGPGSGCSTSAHCTGDLVCAAGTCQFEGSLGEGASCWANRDCASELYCGARGTCEQAGGGDPGSLCATGADCDKRLMCDLISAGGSCVMPGSGDVDAACTAGTDCIAGLGCGQNGFCQPQDRAYPPYGGISCADDTAPFRVLFEVPRPGQPQREFFRLPFPNDIRVSAEGTLDLGGFPRPGRTILGVDVVDAWANALSTEFDGFSPVAAVRFRFSSGFDGDLGADGSAMQYVDITPGAPELGSPRQRRFGYVVDRNRYVCQHSLIVRNEPHEPLLPGHTYAVYLTTDIRSVSGNAPAIDPDFAAVMAAGRPAADEALGHAWDAYAPMRAYVATSGIDPSTIAGATVFTVRDPGERAARLAAQVLSTPLPEVRDLTLCDTGVVSPCTDGEHACRAASPHFHELHGRLRIPVYQQGTPPYQTSGGEITELGGVFQQNGNAEVCFALTIPTAGPQPGAWPLVVYGPGMGARFDDVVATGIGQALATLPAPAAGLSFEPVLTGERRGESSHHPLLLMLNLKNPRAARDSRLQAAVDVLQALRVARIGPLAVSGIAEPISFDPDQTYYMGHSHGADAGVIAGAVADGTPAMMLAATGGSLSERLLGRASPIRTGEAMSLIFGEPLDRHHPFMVLWQTYLDSVDPVSYAPLWYRRPRAGVTTKHLMMIWGAGDTFTAPDSMTTLARTLGLSLAEPVVEELGIATVARPVAAHRQTGDGERMAAVFQYALAAGDGHLALFSAAVADWSAFVSSLIGSGTPMVP